VIEHRVGASRRAGVVRVASRRVARPAMRYFPLNESVIRVFPVLDRAAARLPRSARAAHRPVRGRTWRGEMVTPLDGPTSDGAILYFHGGAFISCGLGTHRMIVERLARRTGMTVLSVDYRQLPTGRLHDSISDCEDAFAWLVRRGHRASSIVLVGDSAGGHLAFATALRLRDEGLSGPNGPAGIVGLSPWLDFDHMAKIRHHNARRDAYIPARRLRKMGRMVIGDHPELHHSPVNADLRGLPPALLICAEDEVLRVDAELMSDRMNDAGVPCTLQVWEGQVHAFPVLSTLVPEARAAVDEVVAFVTAAVGVSSSAVRRGAPRGAAAGVA
jgi:acetyl esterase/lipase